MTVDWRETPRDVLAKIAAHPSFEEMRRGESVRDHYNDIVNAARAHLALNPDGAAVAVAAGDCP